MFYSHEVLISRKYGVATVWLVATLGVKSSLKRINRKQILDVDVSKACQTIVDPVAPMALRLQGSLLYGVSRVYLQQCGYVLSDAQNAHNAMRMMLRTVENRGLDPDAGRAHPEQLILQDDPSFLPDHALALPTDLLDLNPDLETFIAINRSGESQSLTPFGSQLSRQSSSHAGELGGIILPSSSPGPPGSFRVQGADEDVGMTGLIGEVGDDVGFQFDEPEFTFDEDGQLVEGPTPSVRGLARTSVGVGVRSDAAASRKGNEGHADAEMGEDDGVQIPDDAMDLELPVLPDDFLGGASPVTAPLYSSQDIEVVHSTSTTSAPLRKQQRRAKVLPVDALAELKNKDLASWNNDYLKNMDAALKEKKKNRDNNQAKKIAEQFVWGNGIGDIAQQFMGLPVPSQFDAFIGDNLFKLVTGASRTKRGRPKKRDRDSGIDDETQEESRNVRQKSNEMETEMGRGVEDEEVFPLGDIEVELPREAASPLDDEQIFSAMPWNITASIRGSSVVPRSGLNSGQGKPGSKPGSRMVSASPLRGRGQTLGADLLQNTTSDADFDFGGDDFGGLEPSSSANSPITTTAPTTRVTEALSAEGENFVAFVTEALVEKRNHSQTEGEPGTDQITFEELLPPHQNNRMIACQGLMMVLGLGTKRMLDVQQPEHFGDINIKLTDKARAAQVIEISEGEGEDQDEDGDETIQGDDVVDDDGEGEVEVMEGVEGGEFEEQFAAGHGAEEDDRDSLYDD